jgi:hypothetical protein
MNKDNDPFSFNNYHQVIIEELNKAADRARTGVGDPTPAPGEKLEKHPLEGDDYQAEYIAYVRERPKGFIPFEGYIALTDKAARLLMEGGSPEECVQMGKLLHRLGDKFWKLHQNGEGLPQRICECKRGYIPKRGRYCKQCVQEKRRTTWKNEKNRQREKVKE